MSDRPKDADTEAPAREESLLSHLMELRDRLLRMVLGVLVLFVALFPFANTLYSYLAGPLMRHLPEDSSMIAIEVASPFLTPFKLVLVLAVFLSMPYILYQLWAFVAPGLYRHERRLAGPLLISSILLFYTGAAFAYFVVFPLVFGFFTSVAPEGVSVMTDIAKYLDFVIKLFFAFGIAFEVPIATFILVAIGVTTPESLAKKRPYIIVAAFVIGMLLTPPDVISQTLLALPMWVLFELGLIFSRMFLKKPRAGEDADAEESVVAGSGGGGAAMFGDHYDVTEGPEPKPRGGADGGPDSPGGPEPKPGGGADSGSDSPDGPDEPPRGEDRDAESDDEAYRPLSDDEMDAELDRIEREEHGADEKDEDGKGDENDTDEDEKDEDGAKGEDRPGKKPPK